MPSGKAIYCAGPAFDRTRGCEARNAARASGNVRSDSLRRDRRHIGLYRPCPGPPVPQLLCEIGRMLGLQKRAVSADRPRHRRDRNCIARCRRPLSPSLVDRCAAPPFLVIGRLRSIGRRRRKAGEISGRFRKIVVVDLAGDRRASGRRRCCGGHRESPAPAWRCSPAAVRRAWEIRAITLMPSRLWQSAQVSQDCMPSVTIMSACAKDTIDPTGITSAVARHRRRSRSQRHRR